MNPNSDFIPLIKCYETLPESQVTVDYLLNKISHAREQDIIHALIDSPDGNYENASSTVWSNLFQSAFLNTNSHQDGHGYGPQDDLLFFVSKSVRPAAKAELTVARKNSPKVPALDDTTVDWSQTMCLNLLMQYFVYVLTVAVCTRTGPEELQILKKFSETVYCSPSRRRMDSKGNREETVYPDLFFSVENYEELFSTCVLRDSECFCVELTAYDQNGRLQGVCFLGTVPYSALKTFYDSKSSHSNYREKGLLGRHFGSLSNNPEALSSSKQAAPVKFMHILGPESRGSVELAVCPIETDNCHCAHSSRFGLVSRCCLRQAISVGDNDTFLECPSGRSTNFEPITTQPSQSLCSHSHTAKAYENCFPADDWIYVDMDDRNGTVPIGMNSQMHFFPPAIKSAGASAQTSPFKRFGNRGTLLNASANIGSFKHAGFPIKEVSGEISQSSHRNKISSIFSRFSRQSERIDGCENQANRESILKQDGISGVDKDESSSPLSNPHYMSFGQSWSWFKERRRITSVELNVSLTSISLPSQCILHDLYVKREPILNIMD